jgi:hypothetical protein
MKVDQSLKLARSERGSLVADLASAQMTQDEWEDALAERMGVSYPLLSKTLLRQYISALGLDRTSSLDEVNAALQALIAAEPQDLPEMLLIGQMLATNRTALDLMASANKTSFPETQKTYLGLAIRLLRLSAQQVDALGRYRRKGKQEIRIEKVIIDGQSQAIFGLNQERG